MGCIVSSTNPKVNVRDRNIQDEARSYKSKVGAMRIILKNIHSRRALIKYLENYQKAEFVKCFQELEEARLVKEDKIFRNELKKVVMNYKSIMEVAEEKNLDSSSIEFALWDCFGPLRHTDVDTSTILQLNKFVHIAEDSLLSQVCTLFEEFLDSKEYEDCKNFTVENQKMKITHPVSTSTSISSNSKGMGIRRSLDISSLRSGWTSVGLT
jgi:hypothetical protein